MVSAARRVTRSRAESATSRPTSDLHKGVGQRAGLDGRVADKRVNSMIWYKVEINGWHDDRPMTIQATVQASSGKEAVIQAVADEFGVVGEAVEVGFETRHGQRGVRFGIHSQMRCSTLTTAWLPACRWIQCRGSSALPSRRGLCVRC